jgi:hypothetical protein
LERNPGNWRSFEVFVHYGQFENAPIHVGLIDDVQTTVVDGDDVVVDVVHGEMLTEFPNLVES